MKYTFLIFLSFVVLNNNAQKNIEDSLSFEFYSDQNNIEHNLGDNPKEIVEFCLEKTEYYERLGQFEMSNKYLFEASNYISTIGQTNPLLKLRLLKKQARFYEKQGELSEAISIHKEIIEEFKKQKDIKNIGFAYLQIGFNYELMGDFDKALLWAKKVLELGEKMNYPIIIARANTNMGNIFSQTDRKEAAIACFLKAIEYMKKGNAEEGEFAAPFNNLSLVYADLEEFDLAIEFIQRTIKIDKKNNYYVGLIGDYNNLATIYKQKGEYSTAKKYLHFALDEATRLGFDYDISFIAYNLSEVYLKTDKLQKAENYAFLSLDAANGNSLIRASFAYLLLSDIKTAKKDYKKSLEFYKLHQVYNDSIHNQETERTIEELNAKFKSEKKEEEIDVLQKEKALNRAVIAEQKLRENSYTVGIIVILTLLIIVLFWLRQKYRTSRLLKSKNAEIESQSRQIEEELKIKEILVKEIHHRVKNNLQTVSSLLSLHARYLTDENALKAIEESKNRLLSISLLHQKLYSDSHLPIIDLKTYMVELVDRITETFTSTEKDIQIHIHCEKIKCDIDLATPLGLIINELITNAYKHAFENKKKGEISIDLKTVDATNYQLKVTDNGSGLPTGFTIDKTETMGLNLIHLMTRQIKGELKVENGLGTSFTIRFKKPNKDKHGQN